MNEHNHVSYEKDFYGWAKENAELLRQKKFEEIDVEHLAEEIESMGESEKHQLESRFEILMAHLLKWHYQPEARSNSWQGTIKEQRYRISRLIEKNPSLKTKQQVIFDEAYKGAVYIASSEMRVNELQLPEVCPFSLEQCLDESFLPE